MFALLFHLVFILAIIFACGIHDSIPSRLVFFVPLVYFLFGYILRANAKGKLDIWSVLPGSVLLMVPMFIPNSTDAWLYLYWPFLSVLPSYDIVLSPAFLFLAFCPSLFTWSGMAFKADKKMLAAFGLLFLLFLGFIWVPQQNRDALELENWKAYREKTVYKELAVFETAKDLPNRVFDSTLIETEDSKKLIENDFGVVLPEIDLDKYYYVVFWGRKVKFDSGQIQTVEELDKDTIVVYEVNRVKYKGGNEHAPGPPLF